MSVSLLVHKVLMCCMLLTCPAAGGGHKASAEALKQAIEEKYGNKYRVSPGHS
jgi:hypothetical protein